MTDSPKIDTQAPKRLNIHRTLGGGWAAFDDKYGTEYERRALDDAPAHDAITVLATSKGRPWTYNGFSTVWHRWRAEQVAAGHIPSDLTLKGLRHTVATILREAGYTPRQVADYLGQKTESMAIHYSRDADMAERNRAASSALDAEIERRTKVVKPFPKSVKPKAGGPLSD